MRRILALLFTCALLCSNVVCMAAENEVSVLTDSANSSIKVSGTLNASRANSSIMLCFKNSDNSNVFVDFTQSTFNKEKEVEFSFADILLPVDLVSGIYKIEISCEELSSPLVYNYQHYGPDKILEVLKQVKAADGVGTVLSGTENEKALGVDLTEYNRLNTEGKNAFEAIMKEVSYELPENVATETREKIMAELKKCLDAVKRGSAAGLFVMATDSEDVSYWVNNYYSLLGFDEKTEVTEIIKKQMSSDDFVRRIVSAEGTPTIAEIKTLLYESALLSVIKESVDSDVKSIFMNFADFFDIDKDAFNDLSGVEMAEVIKNLSGVTFGTCAEAAEAFNDEIKNVSGSEYTGGGSGSIGNGKGGGGGSYKLSGNSVPSTEKSQLFPDLEEAAWATEAIEYMAKHGVVSGRPDGKFGPNDGITRAEFLKMVTIVFGKELSDSPSPFNDVKDDSWYAPYVVAGYESGLILGGTDGTFRPDDGITRQDMATILYRATGGTGSNLELNFSDADKISDYAKDAVAYFASRGIINGLGDGTFGAEFSATRAQTAMLLYNLLTKPM